MNSGDCFVSYQFTLAEAKALCAMFHDGHVPDALTGFSKTLLNALMRRISLEEAEMLFNDRKPA
ncbi:MAG: hypothetical protein Pg6C_19550 [Treponemataceae bacterium]|nr:MAG: hypothetical protein Pg6C_19550 [Treponemataceae bacterium]